MPNKKKEEEFDASANKFEVAKELGIPLKAEGENQNLTASQMGAIGGHMKGVNAKKEEAKIDKK